MTDLSSAAQAVLDAWDAKLNPMVTCLTHDPEREALAAALRAVADQLQLAMPLGDTDADAGVFAAHHAIRTAIHAIAAELNNQP